jgi:hypothetical protein
MYYDQEFAEPKRKRVQAWIILGIVMTPIFFLLGYVAYASR